MSTRKNNTWKTLFFGASCLALLFFVLYTATFLNAQSKSEKIAQLQSLLGESSTQKKSPAQLPTELEDESDLLDNLTIDFDQETFELHKSQKTLSLGAAIPGGGDNQYIPALSLKLKSLGDTPEVLSIADVSRFTKDRKSVAEILAAFYGLEIKSELRNVTINGITHSFEADHFSEGGPTNEDGSCWQGGGTTQHHFLLDKKLAIVVPIFSKEKGCDGEAPEVINTPDSETIEKVLKAIESISY